MKYRVERKEYNTEKELVGTAIVGTYGTKDAADKAINDDVSYFREHHDNDERIDWDVVEVYDDVGHCNRFVWVIVEC